MTKTLNIAIGTPVGVLSREGDKLVVNPTVRDANGVVMYDESKSPVMANTKVSAADFFGTLTNDPAWEGYARHATHNGHKTMVVMTAQTLLIKSKCLPLVSQSGI